MVQSNITLNQGEILGLLAEDSNKSLPRTARRQLKQHPGSRIQGSDLGGSL